MNTTDLKGGPLAQLAGMWCNSTQFRDWLNERAGDDSIATSADAAALVRRMCGCKESRAELDHDRRCAERFNEFFRRPFMLHQAEKVKP